MKIFPLLICLLIGNIGLAYNCIQADSLYADSLYSLVSDHNKAPRDTVTLNNAKRVLPSLKAGGRWREYIDCLNIITVLYGELGMVCELEEAMVAALEETTKYNKEDISMDAVINHGLYAATNLGDVKHGLAVYKEYLSEYKDKDAVFIAKVNHNLGYLYSSLGDYNNARLYLEEAIAVYGEKMEENPRLEHNWFVALKLLGTCFYGSEKIAPAIQCFEQLNARLGCYTKTYQQKYFSSTVFAVNTKLATIYCHQNDFDTALSYLGKVKPKSDHAIAIYKLLEGKILSRQGKKNLALDSLKLALEKVSERNKVEQGKAWFDYAEILLQLGKREDAKLANRTAIESLCDSLGKNGLPDPDVPLLSESLMLELILQKAKIISKGSPIDKHLLLAIFDYAFVLREKYTQQLFSESSKYFHNEKYQAFQSEAMEIAWQLYGEEQDPKYVDIAFNFMEKGKASVLLEEIKKKYAEGFSNIDSSLLEQRNQLRETINRLKNKEYNTNDAQLIRSYQATRIDRQKELVVLENKLKANSTLYSRLVNETTSIDVGIFQQFCLDGETAILEYYYHNNQLYLIYIDKCKKDFVKVDLTFDLDEAIGSFLEMKGLDDYDGFVALGQQLNEVLVNKLDIPAGIKKLIIVPDKELATFPFEMLVKGNSTVDTSKGIDFLINDYIFSYAYSIMILGKLGAQTNDKGKNFIGFAPTAEGLENVREVNEIARIMNGTARLAKDANLVDFRRESTLYKVIHLSTHAETNGDSTYIRFSDGILPLNMLYTMHLPAKLLVLSACQTGIGKHQHGEGLMSLSRGFTYAGVQSIVATLWRVRERETGNIMVCFYKYLKQGMPKDEALHQAKRDYLKQAKGEKLAPYYWSGIVLIGDTSPVFEQYEPIKLVMVYWPLLLSLLLYMGRLFFSKTTSMPSVLG